MALRLATHGLYGTLTATGIVTHGFYGIGDAEGVEPPDALFGSLSIEEYIVGALAEPALAGDLATVTPTAQGVLTESCYAED